MNILGLISQLIGIKTLRLTLISQQFEFSRFTSQILDMCQIDSSINFLSKNLLIDS